MLALLGFGATAAAQDAQTKTLPVVGPPLVLEITVRRYGPDNFMSASAGDLRDHRQAGKLCVRAGIALRFVGEQH